MKITIDPQSIIKTIDKDYWNKIFNTYQIEWILREIKKHNANTKPL